jgi:hypothetical protein
VTKHKNYDEVDVVRSLRQKNDLRAIQEEKMVILFHGPGTKGDIGIKTKGKLDFLRKYCRYRIIWEKK